MDTRYDIIVVGAGIAGASVAWNLARMPARGPSPPARRGGEGILLLERESAPGTHATAQNAAMIRSLVEEDAVSPLALEGVRFWMAPPKELEMAGRYHQVGGLLLATREESLALLARRAEEARGFGFESEILDAGECRARWPILSDTPILGGVLALQDGIADPAAMVDAFLRVARSRGVAVEFGREVTRVLVEEGRVRGIACGGLEIRAETVVLAAGAWMGQLLASAGAGDHGIVPLRRHIFCSAPTPLADRDMPFVWHADLGAYFREESGGLLFSICDEDPVPPGRPEVAPGISEEADRRLGAVFPFLKDLPLARLWAGLRTFTSDRGFLLGADPDIRGLFHAGALGGHGITCAAPVGRIVSAAVLGTGTASDR